MNTDERFAAEARALFEARCPLEIMRDAQWQPLDDQAALDEVYSASPDRAIDIANGVMLTDGRTVRFEIDRPDEFEEIELIRVGRGSLDSATGYCRTCDARRQLKLTQFAGGYFLRCRACERAQTTYVRAGVPL